MTYKKNLGKVQKEISQLQRQIPKTPGHKKKDKAFAEQIKKRKAGENC